MRSKLFLFGFFLSLFFPPAVLSGALETWYSDVAENHEYYAAIYSMTEAEVVNGYADESFLPLQSVSRVEALKMILELTDHTVEGFSPQTEVSFDDWNEEEWYVPYVEYAFEQGIMVGDESGTLRPNDPVNRVEAIKMLVLAADKTTELPGINNDTWYSAYLEYGILNALLVPDASFDYTPEATLTRGELCELLYRYEAHPYTGEVEFGKATFYSYSMNGAGTASGNELNTYGFEAAHKTLPFGTHVRITRLSNNQSVVVEIVDRGPYGEGRIIDLTPAAFEELGSLGTGVLDVRLEVLND